MVVVKAVKSFDKKVTLADIKSNPKLSEISLIKQSRLSVMPIIEDHWNTILAMGQTRI